MAKAKKSAKASKKSAKAPKAPKAPVVKVPNAPANPLSKSGVIATCAIAAGISGKQATAYYTALCAGSYALLKKNGKFVLPGFAKFVVKKKKATKARKGVNPFTKEPCTFKAKPASKTVRARAIKAIKDV
eukprot:gene10954-8941_t